MRGMVGGGSRFRKIVLQTGQKGFCTWLLETVLKSVEIAFGIEKGLGAIKSLLIYNFGSYQVVIKSFTLVLFDYRR